MNPTAWARWWAAAAAFEARIVAAILKVEVTAIAWGREE